MTYRMASSAGKTVKDFQSEREVAKSTKQTDDDNAAMRAFGFTDDEAANAIDRYITTASPEPVADAWDYSPKGVWFRAYELVEQLEPDNGDKLVNEAMNKAESPKQFWTLLKIALNLEPEEDAAGNIDA